MSTDDGRRVLVVHPSSELYGADRVLYESVRGLVDDGVQVVVTLSSEGPLRGELEKLGVEVVITEAPVLRKAYLKPLGLLKLLAITLRSTPGMLRLMRRVDPQTVYVSTVTTPWWLVLARVRGRRVVCHLHEAEADVPRPVRLALAAPLLAAHEIVANSAVSRQVVVQDLPRLAARTHVIYNGVPGPAVATPPPALDAPVRLVLVGRVSARKGTDVAVDALRLLVESGLDARLDLVGGIFPGYEWFEEQVRAQVTAGGLDDRVRWRGVLSDVWGALAEAHIALVPSRVEPFGNAAVEAMLAWRPVVAGATQGLVEIVQPGVNGELAAPGDAAALAAAVRRIVDDWPGAVERATAARATAEELYAPQRYRRDLVAAVAPHR